MCLVKKKNSSIWLIYVAFYLHVIKYIYDKKKHQLKCFYILCLFHPLFNVPKIIVSRKIHSFAFLMLWRLK